jgi:hypothetical protein
VTETLKHSSRNRLHPGQLHHFPGETLHDRVARALCEARCLPRREFFESWEFVNRARRILDAPVVWDLCAGHGLVGLLFALLEPELEEVVLVDRKRPVYHEKVRTALATLDADRIAKVRYVEKPLEELDPPPRKSFIAAVHACGRRTDRAIDLAIASKSSIAALPCCHEIKAVSVPSAIAERYSRLEAVDLCRIFKLHAAGYRVTSRKIAPDATARADAIMGVAP